MREAELEAILADFRTWLAEVPDDGPHEPDSPDVAKLDVASVVAHFTALRQEVNLLTKSARVSIEQNAQALDELRKPTPADPATLTQPLVKALIDIADALSGAAKSLDKSKELLAELPDALQFVSLPNAPNASRAHSRGFLSRLFGRTPIGDDSEWQAWAEEVAEAQAANAASLDQVVETFEPLLAGLGDGYAISLRRIERLLPQYDLEAIPTVGHAFDPELMEAVEVVERPAGTASGAVVEEVRRGWLRAGVVFRFALVKVAR